MNKKILYSIIAVAFVGGMFTVAYAGPIMPTITLAGTVDMVNNQIKNLQDPTDPQDATTKSYVDSLFSCDGAGQSCVVGLGECQNSGINVCMMGTAQCSVSAGAPSPELCDSLDNDCDGTPDEDFPTKGNVCTVGVGECENNGNLICKVDGSGVECDAVPGVPSQEICDFLDNDCDGQVDEDIVCEPVLGMFCPVCPNEPDGLTFCVFSCELDIVLLCSIQGCESIASCGPVFECIPFL